MTHPRAIRRLACVAALLFCMAAPAAASNYILQIVPGGDLASVLAKYSLVLVRPLAGPGGNVFLVTDSVPAVAVIVNSARNSSGITSLSGTDTTGVLQDAEVLAFESDTYVHTPENAPSAPAIYALDAISVSAASQDTTPTAYYGDTVRGVYVQQWASSLIRLPDAQSRYASGSGIVAVIDTGVDPNHSALKEVLVPGYDFTRDQPGIPSEFADLDQSTVAILDQSTVAILDAGTVPLVLNQSTVAILDQSTVAILDATQIPSDFGHGTMVAGLIHLVAPTAQIMPLKAFRADGSANLSDIVEAVYYAVDNQAKIINMSFSSPQESPSLTAAMEYARVNRVVCVASAGNDGIQETVYPAANTGVIGVGSTDWQDQRSLFSNYGTESVQMGAPGEGLITAYPGNHYAAAWGTSFSTALTSGTVALLNQISPDISPRKAGSALGHGHRVELEGMGDMRLDILSTLRYILFGD